MTVSEIIALSFFGLVAGAAIAYIGYMLWELWKGRHE